MLNYATQNSILTEVTGQLHTPNALPLGKVTLIPTEKEAGQVPEPIQTTFRREKSLTPTEN